MTSDEKWLAAAWPFVRDHAPPPPATVLEIGCGPLGGFVPRLRSAGYDAVGVDPEAPEEAGYHRDVFETYEPPTRVDALVASLSLHHVAALDAVLDRIADTLRPGGTVVVLEWAWERLDERTARWCFDRLATGDTAHSWLHRRRQSWLDSGQSWDDHMRAWTTEDGLHPGNTVLRGLETRFPVTVSEHVPYYFPDLDGVTEADEQAAIDAGLVRAAGIRFVGHRG